MNRLNRAARALVVSALAWGTWLQSSAFAQQGAQEGAQDAAEGRAQSFQAVQGAVQEDVPGGPLLVAAYAVIWVLVLLYGVRLVRQQQKTAADVARLQAQLDKAGS